MVTVKKKIAVELNKINLIWKELVNNRQPDLEKISDIFTRYKSFLEENKHFLSSKSEFFEELELIEAQLSHYEDVSAFREKRMLLNDAYVGLLLSLSETMDELKARMEEVHFTPSKEAHLN